MTDVEFGRLQDLPLRKAWHNEARAFTPWLAENIDHLAEVIGVPLELTGTEVAVGTFAADNAVIGTESRSDHKPKRLMWVSRCSSGKVLGNTNSGVVRDGCSKGSGRAMFTVEYGVVRDEARPWHLPTDRTCRGLRKSRHAT